MKIFLVDLESIPTRYTCEWKTHIPKLLRDNGFNVQVIEGEQIYARVDDDNKIRVTCVEEHPELQEWISEGNTPEEADNV